MPGCRRQCADQDQNADQNQDQDQDQDQIAERRRTPPDAASPNPK